MLKAEMLESSKQLLGTLILLPLVVLLLGSEWTWIREFRPVSVELVGGGADEGAPGAMPSRFAKLSFFDDGTTAHRGLRFGPSEALEFSFERPHRRVRLVVQADGNDTYRVASSSDGRLFEPVWVIPPAPGSGLRTRDSPLLPASPVRRLRIEPVDGDGTYAVSGLKLVEAHRFAHALLIPIIFLAWAGLGALRRSRSGRRFAEWTFVQWRRFDPWIAGLLIFVVLFEVPSSLVLHGFWLLNTILTMKVLHLCVRGLGTARAVALFVTVPLTVIASVIVSASIILSRLSMYHEVNVDHRLLPGGEINEDGIRFDGPASRLNEDDYVVIFLGDSFTFGNGVQYEDSYPYLLERLLSKLDCAAPVRVANFGWVSSSPLLSYRLLREIGHKYKPDLVVYSLDMTDFHDDLRYEVDLRVHGDLELPKYILLTRMLQSFAPFSRWGQGLLPSPRSVSGYFQELAVRRSESAPLEETIPPDRYFVTNQPLAESKAGIERGVVRNLERIFRYSQTDLRSRMLLVILPRAFQYSDRETPENWESGLYEVLGPFAREPFRYFEEARAALPYPVFSLLSSFEESAEFPLYQDDDPHWTVAGNRVAAAGLQEYLVENELVPCASATDP